MPVIHPVTAAPFPSANEVLNRARAITNDAAQSIAGNLLSNAQPYTIEDLNKALEDLAYELANHGYEAVIDEAIVEGLPACDSTVQTDPGIQLWMSYQAYFDGLTETETPIIPNDVMIPLRIWERQNGSLQNFYEMAPVNDGLPSIQRTSSLRYWDWRGNKIYFVGALQVQDIRIRYVKRLDSIVDADAVIPIPDSKNALANLIAATFAKARGSALAQTFMADAEKDIERIVSRTARKKQRGQHRRKPWGHMGSTQRL